VGGIPIREWVDARSQMARLRFRRRFRLRVLPKSLARPWPNAIRRGAPTRLRLARLKGQACAGRVTLLESSRRASFAVHHSCSPQPIEFARVARAPSGPDKDLAARATVRALSATKDPAGRSVCQPPARFHPAAMPMWWIISLPVKNHGAQYRPWGRPGLLQEDGRALDPAVTFRRRLDNRRFAQGEV